MEGSWDCPVPGCLGDFPCAAALEAHFEHAHAQGGQVGCAACETWVTIDTFRTLHRLASKKCSRSHREGMQAAFRAPGVPRNAVEAQGVGLNGARYDDDDDAACDVEPHNLPGAPPDAAAPEDVSGFPQDYYDHYRNAAYANRRVGEHNPFFAQFARDIKHIYGCVFFSFLELCPLITQHAQNKSPTSNVMLYESPTSNVVLQHKTRIADLKRGVV